ncbi:MAG: DSD1 family PLP-dependent enzyme [Oscillospiraceae bacterium]|nr:DSD1 family PLP-dependent enzyme [Oscillospiraceae bacterium]
MKLSQLQTPALVVNADVLEKNERAMAALLAGSTARLRPHYKSHKCAAIAHRQIAAGAVGMTCAKLEEAEDLVDSGVADVLIANQIVDPRKLRRAAELALLCRLTVCVDDAENARALSQAAVQAGATVHVLVEYEIGMERCGVADADDYVALAKLVDSLPGLHYDGIQAYAGHVSHMPSAQERLALTAQNEQAVRSLLEKLAQAGLTAQTISGGSTGTAAIKARHGLYTELQAGSYLFMDSTYRQLHLPFENSLFLLTTVVSRRDGLAIMDAGVKSLGVDQDDPVLFTLGGAEIHCARVEANEEHLKLFAPDRALALGEKVLVMPGHCCSTVNLHERIYLYRSGEIVDRLQVTARGKSR